MSIKKIFNDPVHGFITINNPLILSVLNHATFQRLRRIAQLGLTNYVYPGAIHTRFHHALGAYHLMRQAISSLKEKGILITEEEELGACIASLMHDIGHGPFSHALENTIIKGVHHEELSLRFMQQFNQEFHGKLDTAIAIFKGNYPKKFLHSLISGQLDVDRLDYLTRDSFFTGVNEGVISHDRILNMLDVDNDTLVVEEKGIYSVEKFLISRRLMYWQVYLHKTVLCAEMMLIKVMERAKYLAKNNIELPCSKALRFFLYQDISPELFMQNDVILQNFAKLDDFDILSALKFWSEEKDFILSTIATAILNRNLYKVKVQEVPFKNLNDLQEQYSSQYKCSIEEAKYLVFDLKISHTAYDSDSDSIKIKNKNNVVVDFFKASDMFSKKELSQVVTKYFLFEMKS